jgi:hypothetical protein
MRREVATPLGLKYEVMPHIAGRDDALTFRSGWAEWLLSIVHDWPAAAIAAA